jgi:hypothetical protein
MSITADDILGLTKSVTKERTKQRIAEERHRRSRMSREYVYSDRVYFTDVAKKILPPAYQHASGNGQYSVSKRQFFYACREAFKNQTGRELEFNYFAGTLLVQFINRNPEETAAWKVTADPRGTLTIPNANHEVHIPCGTLQIEEHLRCEAGSSPDPYEIDAVLDIEWPSLKAGERYQAVMYLEKEGFEPLLKEAKIAQRFDLAILSCKGMSVVAGRKFVDEVCRVDGGVPLFVVHDFDKSGFEIAQRLTSVSDWALENDRVAYEFQNEINFTDLGLRLSDINAYGLVGERCKFSGHFASDSICTEPEKEFLRSGKRVELNELTSPQFIEWLENKLRRHLPKRLIPKDAVLTDAYRRAYVVARINKIIEEEMDDIVEEAKEAKVAKSLRKQLRAKLNDESGAWDRVLYELVKRGVTRRPLPVGL